MNRRRKFYRLWIKELVQDLNVLTNFVLDVEALFIRLSTTVLSIQLEKLYKRLWVARRAKIICEDYLNKSFLFFRYFTMFIFIPICGAADSLKCFTSVHSVSLFTYSTFRKFDSSCSNFILSCSVCVYS